MFVGWERIKKTNTQKKKQETLFTSMNVSTEIYGWKLEYFRYGLPFFQVAVQMLLAFFSRKYHMSIYMCMCVCVCVFSSFVQSYFDNHKKHQHRHGLNYFDLGFFRKREFLLMFFLFFARGGCHWVGLGLSLKFPMMFRKKTNRKNLRI